MGRVSGGGPGAAPPARPGCLRLSSPAGRDPSDRARLTGAL